MHAFLTHGASANTKDRRSSPALLWAIGSDQRECLRLRLKSGAGGNVRDADGMGALALARRKNKADLLEILLATGAKEESAIKK